MSGIEGDGGKGRDDGGEIGGGSEVNEDSAAETGGESTQAEREDVLNEANKVGGFSVDPENGIKTEDVRNQYGKRDLDDSQKVGFSEDSEDGDIGNETDENSFIDSRDQMRENLDAGTSKLSSKVEGKDNRDAHTIALNNMTEYMSAHNYGRYDYPTYSRAPEWKQLNAELQRSSESGYTRDATAPSSEDVKDASVVENSDIRTINASEIDMSYAQGMGNDQFWNHHGNNKEEYMNLAERIPDVQRALNNGMSLDEIKKEPELKDTAEAYFDLNNMVKVEQQTDGSFSFVDDGRHRIVAAQELNLEIPVKVIQKTENPLPEAKIDYALDKEQIEGMAYSQGNNTYGYAGTCGPTTVANALNRVTGSDKFNENSLVDAAVKNNLCSTSGDIEDRGATDTDSLIKLMDKVTVTEDNIKVELYEYDNALTTENLTDKLKSSKTVAIVGVDSKTLWDERVETTNNSLSVRATSVYSDHWIMVDSPKYDDNGKLVGFSIVDSGGAESYVDKDKFEAMYKGNDNFSVIDSTCIIISKVESNADSTDLSVQPKEALHPKYELLKDENVDLPTQKAEEVLANFGEVGYDVTIPSRDIETMPENVQKSYSRYEHLGWPKVGRLPEQTPGTCASKDWVNRGNPYLPKNTPEGTPITYQEHDVNDRIAGHKRDGQRFVTGSDGSVYYTDDHYKTFTKLK